MSATALLTFAEFERLPDQPGKRELIKGELIEMPPPLLNHTLTAQALFLVLHKAFAGARVFMEAGYKVGENWIQPDISVTWPNQQHERGYLAGAPLMAIEILSEHKSPQQVESKLNLYFEYGAREVWTVSRKRRDIIVHRQDEAGVRTNMVITDEYQPDWLDVAIRPAELIVD